MIFPENYVDGQVLFELTEKELLDIIKPIGIVKIILSLMIRYHLVQLYTCYLTLFFY